MKSREKTLIAKDRARISLTVFEPERSPVGAVLIAHGFGEHAGRYAHVAEYFISRGLVVYAHDQRGHGKTPGKRGAVRDHALLAQDVRTVLDAIRADHPGLPVALYGHSMGATTVLGLLADGLEGACCAVATSPFFKPFDPPPRAQVALLKVLSVFVPNLTAGAPLNLSLLTHDEKIVEKTRRDPLYHNKMGVRMYLGNDARGETLIKEPFRARIPLLLCAAGEDRIVSLPAIRAFAEHAGAALEIIPGAYHELHNETQRAALLKRTCDFILDNMSKTMKKDG